MLPANKKATERKVGWAKIKNARKPRQWGTSCGCYVSVLTGSTSPHSAAPDEGEVRESCQKGNDFSSSSRRNCLLTQPKEHNHEVERLVRSVTIKLLKEICVKHVIWLSSSKHPFVRGSLLPVLFGLF